MSAPIAFTIPLLLDTPNRTRGQHWAVTAAYKKRIAQEVWIALGGRLPAAPLARSRVTVWRHSTQEPDFDNMVASLKPIADVLQPATDARKYGLGIILDDKPACCEIVARWVKAKRSNQYTSVVVEAV